MRPSRTGSARRSVRRWVGTIGVTGILLAAVALTGVFSLAHRAEEQLIEATDAFVEEQTIADRISHGVMRQLLAVSAIRAGADTASTAGIIAVGEDTYAEIRRYLSRELTTDERLQLERVKEGQQGVEVAALHATAAYRDGDLAAGDESFASMARYGGDLVNALAGFLALRESGLLALRADQQRVFGTAFAAGLALTGALLVGALTVGWLLHRRVATPLGELNEAVNRLASGDLDARVPDQADEEFATLAESFNQMAANLRELQDDLERRNAELEDAVHRIRETRAELLRSEKLSTVGRMTAGLAHELNNPLASILGYAELLEAELRSEQPPAMDEIRAQFVAPIVGEARRSHHLTKSLLLFSRRSEATAGPVPIREAVDVAVNLRAFAFDGSGLSLDVETLPDEHVLGDRQHLQETVLNILNNALHALQAGGGTRVRVHGRVRGDTLVLRFDDDGPGFDDPELALEPFYTTKPADEGTGLGLAMVVRYMEECGGSVQLRNLPDGGARVELRFQLASTPTTPSDEPADGASDGAPRRFARDRRILVVDDEAHLRVIQERILSRAGASTLAVSSTAEARAALASEPFDLVISDVRMPGGGGMGLYRWIGSEQPKMLERILFVTGDVTSPEVVDLADSNPDMFLRKPFAMDAYLGRVEAMLS